MVADYLSRDEMRNLTGGSGDYSCYCNGHYIGDGESSYDCARKCAACSSCW